MEDMGGWFRQNFEAYNLMKPVPCNDYKIKKKLLNGDRLHDDGECFFSSRI